MSIISAVISIEFSHARQKSRSKFFYLKATLSKFSTFCQKCLFVPAVRFFYAFSTLTPCLCLTPDGNYYYWCAHAKELIESFPKSHWWVYNYLWVKSYERTNARRFMFYPPYNEARYWPSIWIKNQLRVVLIGLLQNSEMAFRLKLFVLPRYLKP
jgi:hypothetical protein